MAKIAQYTSGIAEVGVILKGRKYKDRVVSAERKVVVVDPGVSGTGPHLKLDGTRAPQTANRVRLLIIVSTSP